MVSTKVSMKALILLHRWLGVAFCLLFGMWFASGIVMHFVPFPAFTEAERLAGLAPIDRASIKYGPVDALEASGISDAARIRLIQRGDGPVYLIRGSTATAALHAADLSDAAVRSRRLALAIATDYAANRKWATAAAKAFGPAAYDQWTVPDGFDVHRPLYRVALNDAAGTDLYVSSTTGEVVLKTKRRQRIWNYVGSIAHWIYPAALRSHPMAWSRLLWWLSFLALIGASAGATIGTMRLGADGWRLSSPYRGWHAWHHWLGLCCMPFVLSWIFSGWLSMDNGRLFSQGQVTAAETAAIAGSPAWSALSTNESQRIAPRAKEVEWFAFAGRIYRRERIALTIQRMAIAAPSGDMTSRAREFLEIDELSAAAKHLARSCDAPFLVDGGDAYAPVPTMPKAPVFRVVCGDDWFQVDGASGALLEKLDSSRRAYRWLYSTLHTFDVPALKARPTLRTALIITLCTLGFAFSLSGVWIAGQRLRLHLSSLR